MNIYGSSAGLSDYCGWHAKIYDWTRWIFLFGRWSSVIVTCAQHTEVLGHAHVPRIEVKLVA